MPTPSYLQVLHIPRSSAYHWGGTCLYVLGHNRLTLVDTGNIDQAGSHMIMDYLEKRRPSAALDQILITHCHRDHVGGLKKIWERWKPRVLGHPIAVNSLKEQWDFADAEPAYDNQVIDADGVSLQVLYAPGHSADHLCFWEASSLTAFTGDLVVGRGTAMVINLIETIASLRRLLELQPTLLYPGHGPVVPDGVRRIRWYIGRRLTRERQLLRLLGRHPHTLAQLVGTVYPKLDARLNRAAENSLMAHLAKLEGESRVLREQDGNTTLFVLVASEGKVI